MDRIESIHDDDGAFKVPRKGWLVNMLPSTRRFQVDDKVEEERACLEMFFLESTGKRFCAYVAYEPYFYVLPRANRAKDCKQALERKFETHLLRCEIIELADLDVPNHLSFKKKSAGGNVIKLVFRTVPDLMQVRKVLLPMIQKNQSGLKAIEAYSTGANLTADSFGASAGFFRTRGNGANVLDDYQMEPAPMNKGRSGKPMGITDALSDLIEIREYDVPYYQRVCIDLNINAGCWFEILRDAKRGCVVKKLNQVEKAEPVVLAFDIECTKQPLKFPDPSFDQVFMISYMIDKIGYLIINRTIVSSDISGFEYTPKAEFPGPFHVFNEADEKATLRRFFDHVKEVQPNVFVTYNGDSFDFPFVEARATVHGMSMSEEIGISRVQSSMSFQENKGGNNSKHSKSSFHAAGKKKSLMATPEGLMNDNIDPEANQNNEEEDDDEPKSGVFGGGEYRGRSAVHIDCLYWVKRDSYLPAGSRSLKAVTKAKLGYDPVEVDPEDMVRLARERPEYMASYSVSDAVATFYLYDKYIHLFVFSLCTIIPLGSEDVLRKGSGTLCESLLMVEAFNKRIICPNKQVDSMEKFYNGHLIESETYVGGHVECLESGVFREDIPIKFDLDPQAFKELIDKIDGDLKFAIEVEGGKVVGDCTNYDSVREQIVKRLTTLQEDPLRFERPSIYHLDVGAMYPNIILTNRLQPCAVVDDTICASCDFNRPESDCKRQMPWEWRGEMYPASKADFNQIRTQLEYENVDGSPFRELNRQEQNKIVRSRLKDYCQVSFKRVKDTVQEARQATICQRENPFYVDTVRAFRDRRNLYKAEGKKWTKKAKACTSSLDKADCETKVLLYDSLQLAHKCILNSFYGYVMRKGARWHSMEMAAVVTKTGSDLIKQARDLVERVGKLLELDTDGIWCVLPQTFPENFTFEFKDGSSHNISFPCVMLNADVNAKFTNHQYQDLAVGPDGQPRYDKRSECSIFFEVDGPYRCMVLPASQEEGKLLKKRYAVFNKNGTLAELKGFELKRRGELKIIKHFQAQVFEKFLCGDSLEQCYQAVAEIANFWLDVLFTKGRNLTDEEVIDLISENRSMSRALSDYGDQKSTSITTARRLAEFLGDDMVREKGLACQLLIASKPYGAPTTDRAVPTLIFSTEPHIRDACLRKWLRDSSLSHPDVRDVIDWEYYIDRLGKTIQKIITIPAALQRVPNPVPRVKHPEWLARDFREKTDVLKQQKIDTLFARSRQKIIADPPMEGDDDESKSEDGEGDEVMEIVDKTNKEVQKKLMESSSIIDLSASKPVEVVVFEEWLASRKQLWRERRLHKRSKRSVVPSTVSSIGSGGAGSSSTVSTEPKGGMVSQLGLARFANEARSKQENDTFHVLEVRENPSDPGVLSMYVLGEESGFRTVRVQIPRVFYFDSSDPAEESIPLPRAILSRQKTTRALPHGRPAKNLYRVEVDEKLFRLNSKDLTNYLTRPQVEAVYEMQVPLVTRLICDLSVYARLNPIGGGGTKSTTRGRGNATIYTMQELEKVETPSRSYLSQPHLRVFLYHIGERDRQMIAMFLVEDDQVVPIIDGTELSLPKSCQSAYVWFSGGEEPVNVERLLHDELNKVPLREGATFPLRCEFDSPPVVQSLVNGEALWKECAQTLEEKLYDRTKKGPLVLVVQSRLGKHRVLEKLQRQEDVCCVEMPADDFVLPSLLWRRLGVKRALLKFLGHTQWWTDRLESSRFGNIPIAHVGEDHFVTLADYLFARSLQNTKMVLWASPSGTPDLGGIQDDMSQLVVMGEFENPSTMRPGAYRSVCVEIDVLHLAVNAVLESSRVIEIDFHGQYQSQQDAVMSSEQDLFASSSGHTNGSSKQLSSLGRWSATHGDVSKTFKLLKNLTMIWFRDAVDAQQQLSMKERQVASKLLIHLYRWLASPKSFMHDPALHRFVHSLMSKLFFRLLAEIRALGGEIVCATFEKIVVCTGKTDVVEAKDWVEHCLRTLQERDLFQHLQFSPSLYWRQLLYMDNFNLGGVQWDPDFPDRLNIVTNNWNAVSYLPLPVQEFVLMMIGEFMYKPTKRQAQGKSLANVGSGETGNGATGGDGGNDEEEFADDQERDAVVQLRKLVAVDFTQRLLKFIPLVVAEQNKGHLEFPVLPGSHLSLHNPALEVIKTVSAVLGLDASVRDHVRVMKRQALRSIQMMEFAPEAQFRNPALSLVLPDVICAHCNHCEDLDLCRDSRMDRSQKATSDDGRMEDENEDEDGLDGNNQEGTRDWNCPRCRMPYDKSVIEDALVQIVHRRSLAFQLQDLVCVKCRTVRNDNLSEYCTCSGHWVWSQLTPAQFVEIMEPFERVAEYHEFEWLGEVTEFALRGPLATVEETVGESEVVEAKHVNLAQFDFGN